MLSPSIHSRSVVDAPVAGSSGLIEFVVSFIREEILIFWAAVPCWIVFKLWDVCKVLKDNGDEELAGDLTTKMREELSNNCRCVHLRGMSTKLSLRDFLGSNVSLVESYKTNQRPLPCSSSLCNRIQASRVMRIGASYSQNRWTPARARTWTSLDWSGTFQEMQILDQSDNTVRSTSTVVELDLLCPQNSLTCSTIL